MNFNGAARRLDDIDLPKVGTMIGVGEDEIHAVIDVESRGSGFDRNGRPLILFEPHVFYRELGPGKKRDLAVSMGLAYEKWGAKPYPADSYPRLLDAMKIDETAALKSASWGLGQVMGGNFKAAGYLSVQAMIRDFVEDEEHHLRAMINFIKANKLDNAIRRHDWASFARGYNGPGYAKNEYDIRLARSFAKWRKIPDSKWNPVDAAVETIVHDQVASNVTATPPAKPSLAPAPALPPVASVAPPIAVPAPAPAPSWWQRFKAALKGA